MTPTSGGKTGGSLDWTPEQRAYVLDKQERAYRSLAEEMGLGSDPQQAFARVSGPLMPLPHQSSDKFKEMLGAQNRFTNEEWKGFDAKVEQTYQRYFTLEPPTPYEDPNRYASMAMTFDMICQAYLDHEYALDPRPLFATLPSGDVNAKVSIEPETNVPIIFFEHGLFRFFGDFARWVGWVVPPLGNDELFNDTALISLPRRYTMPPQSSQFLAGLLFDYVAYGTPHSGQGVRLSPPRHNLYVAMHLLNEGERFVMAHEVAHLILGHLNRAPRDPEESWEREHEADVLATSLIGKVGYDQYGSWATSFWACDVTLSLFNLLAQALGFLHFGTPALDWISATHPDPITRRNRNRSVPGVLSENLSRSSHAAASALCGMSDSLFGRLWDIVLPILAITREQGARASRQWTEYITRSMARSGT